MAVLAFDLGGTKLAAAMFTQEGDIVFASATPLGERTGRDVGQLVLDEADLLLQKAAEENQQVTAIGICVPGIAYAQTGNVWAPNIPGWKDYPLGKQLKEKFEPLTISAFIDSDRACSILGEVWKGNARGCRDAVFLTVGTGIGAGILADNRILRGAGDIAGAIGWMGLDRPYSAKYNSCGCFEYHASGEGIARVAKEWLHKQPSVLLSVPGMEITAKDVFAAAENGDALAVSVIQNAVECWGMAVANLVSLFNPEKIIFGGGVFGPALKYMDAIAGEAKKWAQPIAMRQVMIQGSALGTEAGLYGAGKLALDSL